MVRPVNSVLDPENVGGAEALLEPDSVREDFERSVKNQPHIIISEKS